MSGQATTRQAANVTITRATRRYGSYPGGYQIINTSLTATVWAADNPSCAPNAGTPVNPGTSIVWNTDGELFMCLGTDAQSATAASADVIISYDVQGYQPNPIAIATQILNSGVIVVDQPVVLNNTVIGIGGTAGPYDVSRYNSIMLNLSCLTAARGWLDIIWSNDANLSQNVATDHINWLNPTNSDWSGQIPCRSAYVYFVSNNIAIANVVIASNRQVNEIRNTLPYKVAGDYNLLFDRQVAIPAGAYGTSTYIPPWFGEVELLMQSSQPGLYQVDSISSGPIVPSDGMVYSVTPGTDGAFTQAGVNWNRKTIPMVGSQLRITPFNQGGVAASNYCIVQPKKASVM